MDFDGFIEWENPDVAQEGEDQDNDQVVMQDPMAVVNDIIVESQVLYQDDLSSLPDRALQDIPMLIQNIRVTVLSLLPGKTMTASVSSHLCWMSCPKDIEKIT